MAGCHLPVEVSGWITQLAGGLHGRLAWRLQPLLSGLLFGRGRRTVAEWLRAAGLGQDFRLYYYFLGSLGRNTSLLAAKLLRIALERIAPGDRLLFAIDDTPTERYGKHVEGAGIHHDPTPGPAGGEFLYGHVWVTLAWVVAHPLWGTIGLPLLAFLYVRQKDIGFVKYWYGVDFQTKLEQAAWLVRWLTLWLKYTGKTLWIVVDGAYAKRPFLQAALAAGAVVVSRLRKDAALRSVPPPRPSVKRKRGRPAKYGSQAISLAKRAGHHQGWIQETFLLYGKTVSKTYKTFLATYRPAGGLIRVVLVKEDRGWVAFFCSDANASVADILSAVADRSAIEQVFHDVKEVHGAGQQQVRNYWANLAVYHLNLWWHTLVELWAWNRSHAQLVDRRDRPWDKADRRPSHADRRNSLRRLCVQEEFRIAVPADQSTSKIRRLFQGLLKRAA
jgi:hypothetical protein